DYGRRLYRAFGKEDQIAFFHDPTAGHGYQQKKREAAYGWFLKWLMNRGDGSPVREDPVETEAWNSGELKSFGADGKRAAGPATEAFVKRVADGIVSAGNVKPSEFFRVEVPSAPSVRVESRTAQRIEAPVGPVTIPAFLLRANAAKGLLIAIDDRGK